MADASLDDDLIDRLKTVEALGGLPADVLSDVGRELSIIELADGDTLIRQGDHGSALCIVLSGTLVVMWRDATGVERSLPDQTAGSLVGEVNILSETPALATVRARGAVTLAQLTRRDFDRFAEQSPAGALAVIDVLRPHLHRQACRFTLRHAKAFRDFDPQLLADLERELEPVSLYSGETLMRQGEAGDAMYIVISGRLRVVRRDADGQGTLLAEVGAGETLGEMAIITGEPRSADVIAIRDAHLARISKAAAERLLARHPIPALTLLAHGPVSRVRTMSSGRPQLAPVATIAIVASGPDAPVDAFGRCLRDGLSRLGPALRVTSEFVDSQLGKAGVAQAFDRHGASARLIEWLAEQELEHRFVLYQADTSCTPWTERSIRQADHVVIVANAAGDPRPGEIETELLRREPESPAPTLALCYQPDQTPSGSERWIAPRRLARHIHVRMDQSADFERVARLLTGQSVGLVLGGGFARGLAHIGILRALREYGIPVDALGGSSMGAMIGAQHLLGWDDERIVRELTEGLARASDDLTIPFLAFKRGGTHSRLLQKFFGEKRIEDLWLPFFCTSSNLNRADLKIHTTGLLSTALLATTRAPGVFPPMVIDGELHVDGGLINNVPVDVMKTFSNQGTVIGVDVSPPHQIKPTADYGDDVSGWQAIWNRFNPTRTKRSYRPSILLVLMRLIEFGGISYRVRNASFADLYISPDVLPFKRNDFHKAPQLIEAGYLKAREDIGAWLDRARLDGEAGRSPLPPFQRVP